MRPIAPGAALASALVLWFSAGAAAQPECGAWEAGLFPRVGADHFVSTLEVFDDGAGPALYVGGQFSNVGSVAARGLARWDGAAFSPMPMGGLDGDVYSSIVFDDGTGPALFLGGQFTTAGGAPAESIVKWDGVAYSPLGAGLSGGGVYALAIFDDGGGPALHAAGNFSASGGAPVIRAAKWDGAAWLPLGSGMNGFVIDLAVHDDGQGGGPALYAGGLFTEAGGSAASRVARWDGVSWAQVGNGLNGAVLGFVEFDAGSGSDLFAVGSFTESGFATVENVGRWNGVAWSGLPGPFVFPPNHLFVHDFDGSGPALCVVEALDFVYRRSGNDWIRVTQGDDWQSVSDTAVFDAGSGPRLYAGGSFMDSRGRKLDHLARWESTEEWVPLVAGIRSTVEALLVHDDGSGGGRALFAGASVRLEDGGESRGVAKWDGSAWTAIGATGLNGRVLAMAEFGGDLVVGGEFTEADGVPASLVARWDGASYFPLGSGIDGTSVRSLAVFDDGSSGLSLYAAGRFATAGGVATNGIARWDGAAWHSVAGGITGGVTLDVHALAVHDDGVAGPALYAGGHFTEMGGVAALNVARWDGVAFTPVGPGLVGTVYAFADHDDGAGFGPRLFAGGALRTVDSQVFVLAAWDGAAWGSEGGGGLDAPGAVPLVYSLAAANLGLGPELVAGGFFTEAGGLPASCIARWNGAGWTALAGGTSRHVRAIAPFFDGREGVPAAALYAGGDFEAFPDGVPVGRLARYFDPCAASVGGTVNSATATIADVLFVNGSTGGSDRRVEMTTTTPLSVEMATPPALGGGSAAFAAYVFAGGFPAADVRRVPGLGYTCRPTPLSPGGPSPKLRHVWNNTGIVQLGTASLPSTPTPTVIANRPAGTGRALTFTLQGVIADPGSAGRQPWSVTNAVTVRVQ